MKNVFLSLEPDAPEGFEYRIPTKHDLLGRDVALYAGSAEHAFSLVENLKNRVTGFIITKGSEFTIDPISGKLSHLTVPDHLLPWIHAITSVLFSIITPGLQFYDKNRILEIELSECRATLKNMRIGYNENTKRLRLQIEDLERMADQLSKTTVSVEVLKDEQQRFHDITKVSEEWIWEMDSDGYFTYSNAVVETILGYHPQDINGKHFSTFIHPDTWDRNYRDIGKRFRSNAIFSGYTLHVIRKNGEKVILEINAVPIIDQQEKSLGYRGVARNITDRIKAEEALKDAETSMRSLLENSPDFIINIDRNLVIQYVNKRIGNTAENEVIGKSILDYILPEDKENYRDVIATVFGTGENTVLVNQMDIPDGIYRWFQNRFVAIKGNGSVKGLLLIATDITNRKQAEIKLEQANKQLIEAAHQAGMAQIASETIHNIGNILNSVIASVQSIEGVLHGSIIEGFKKANTLLSKNIDMLESFILEDPKGKKLMQYYLQIEKIMTEEYRKISEHTNRLSGKIDTIAEVIAAQQSYAGFQMLSDHYSISEVIEDALTIVKSENFENYHITIVKDFKEIQNIPLQKTKLVHILINLFRNARDAMIDTPADKKYLKIYTYSDDQAAYIKVTDSGHGISKEDLNRIFNHGFTTKKTGHGFGLHSSANYMTEMGGSMWCESDGPGKGASFILKFNTN